MRPWADGLLQFILFERNGFGRGGEINSFSGELGLHFVSGKIWNVFLNFSSLSSSPKADPDFQRNPTVKHQRFSIGNVTKILIAT